MTLNDGKIVRKILKSIPRGGFQQRNIFAIIHQSVNTRIPPFQNRGVAFLGEEGAATLYWEEIQCHVNSEVSLETPILKYDCSEIVAKLDRTERELVHMVLLFLL